MPWKRIRSIMAAGMVSLALAAALSHAQATTPEDDDEDEDEAGSAAPAKPGPPLPAILESFLKNADPPGRLRRRIQRYGVPDWILTLMKERDMTESDMTHYLHEPVPAGYEPVPFLEKPGVPPEDDSGSELIAAVIDKLWLAFPAEPEKPPEPKPPDLHPGSRVDSDDDIPSKPEPERLAERHAVWNALVDLIHRAKGTRAELTAYVMLVQFGFPSTCHKMYLLPTYRALEKACPAYWEFDWLYIPPDNFWPYGDPVALENGVHWALDRTDRMPPDFKAAQQSRCYQQLLRWWDFLGRRYPDKRPLHCTSRDEYRESVLRLCFDNWRVHCDGLSPEVRQHCLDLFQDLVEHWKESTTDEAWKKTFRWTETAVQNVLEEKKKWEEIEKARSKPTP